MTENYYLFRGDQLVYKNENQQVLGAGQAHAMGREGDILLHFDNMGYTAFQWNQPNDKTGELPWPVAALTDEQFKRYKTLIMLQR